MSGIPTTSVNRRCLDAKVAVAAEDSSKLGWRQLNALRQQLDFSHGLDRPSSAFD